MTVRIPLSPLDQAVFHLDQGPAPWSCHFEARVPGRLDPERLAAAVIAAAGQHPIARARLAAYRGRDRLLHWEIPDRLDRVPLEVVDCPDDDAAAEARSRLLSRRVALDEGPPFALTLARRPEGDSLIMNLSHVAGDGASGLLLLGSIARAYLGDGEPGSPAATPFEVRDLLAGIARPAKDAVKQPRHSGPTAGVALDGGRTGAPGLGFCRMRFEPSATAGILGRRVAPATLNDVLLGSLAVAIRRFNDRAGVAPATVSLGMPVDLRPAGWAEGVVSNIVWAASVPIAPEAQSDLVSAQLAAAERTRVIKDQRVRGELVDVPPMIGSWPVGRLHLITRAALARPIAKRLSSRFDTTGLSNLGRFDGSLDFGDAAGPASELWWSPPALTPPGIGIGAVTMNDELFLTVRYTHEQFDAAGGARFARTWRDVLEAERPEQRS